VEYEWDLAKARSNAAKHRVHFGDAVAALEDERGVTIRDPFSDEEERWITVGQDAFGRVLVVVYSWRGENVRLISARLATQQERSDYREKR
jgi:uncharacterized DUF497 family protein